MLKPGDTIKDKYVVKKELGSGGTSTVWLSEEIKTGKEWAIKEIDKENPVYLASLNSEGTLTEVKIVRELNHIFIPKVNDVFEDDKELLIVMEYIDGLDLDEILSRISSHRLKEEDVLIYGKELAEIFMYLHTRENPIIYRDLKPANVMINQDGNVRLIDFGIAEYLYGEKVQARNIGTNGFASPEHSKEVDERSDIFTLGRTLYVLLAGEISYEKKVKTINGKEKEFKVYTPKPFKEMGIDVTESFERIIFKCMEKDPDDRYQSASNVLEDLLNISNRKRKVKRRIKEDELVNIILVSIGLLAALAVSIFFLIRKAFDLGSSGIPKI